MNMTFSLKQMEINRRKAEIGEAFRRRHEGIGMKCRVKVGIAQIRYQQYWGE